MSIIIGAFYSIWILFTLGRLLSGILSSDVIRSVDLWSVVGGFVFLLFTSFRIHRKVSVRCKVVNNTQKTCIWKYHLRYSMLLDMIIVVTLFDIRFARIHGEVLMKIAKDIVWRDLETKYKMHHSVICQLASWNRGGQQTVSKLITRIWSLEIQAQIDLDSLVSFGIVQCKKASNCRSSWS